MCLVFVLGLVVGGASAALGQESPTFPAPLQVPGPDALPGAGAALVPVIQPIFPERTGPSPHNADESGGMGMALLHERTVATTGRFGGTAVQAAAARVRVSCFLAQAALEPEPAQVGDVAARLAELLDLRAIGYHPGVESAWSRTLSYAVVLLELPAGAADSAPWDEPQQQLFAALERALSQADNGVETRELRRRIRVAEIRDAVVRQDIEATIRLGQRYLALHAADAEVQHEVLAARWADVQRIAEIRGWTSDTLEQIWHQTVMLEGTEYADVSIERLLQAFEREMMLLTAADVDRLTRGMQRLGATSPRLGARHVLGRAHYLAALRIWRLTHEQPDADQLRHIKLHVLRATQAGYMADPEGMIATMHMRAAAPLLLPLLLLIPLLFLPLRRSRWLRRQVARRAYARALRERRQGQIDESATWLAAVTEYLRTTDPLDTEETLLLADACLRLMRDALERARPQEARVWADRIQDLHPEFWPDGFERLAQRLGMSVQPSGAAP